MGVLDAVCDRWYRRHHLINDIRTSLFGSGSDNWYSASNCPPRRTTPNRIGSTCCFKDKSKAFFRRFKSKCQNSDCSDPGSSISMPTCQADAMYMGGQNFLPSSCCSPSPQMGPMQYIQELCNPCPPQPCPPNPCPPPQQQPQQTCPPCPAAGPNYMPQPCNPARCQSAMGVPPCYGGRKLIKCKKSKKPKKCRPCAPCARNSLCDYGGCLGPPPGSSPCSSNSCCRPCTPPPCPQPQQMNCPPQPQMMQMQNFCQPASCSPCPSPCHSQPTVITYKETVDFRDVCDQSPCISTANICHPCPPQEAACMPCPPTFTCPTTMMDSCGYGYCSQFVNDDWGCCKWCLYACFILLASILLLGALVVILLLTFVVYKTVTFDFKKKPVQAMPMHPVMEVLGFITLMGFAMLTFRICRCFNRCCCKICHCICHLLALVCIGVGLAIAWSFVKHFNRKHLYSIHSWLGLMALTLFILQLIFGFFTFILLACCSCSTMCCRARMIPIHSAFGLATFFIAVAACLTGLMHLFIQLQVKRAVTDGDSLPFEIPGLDSNSSNDSGPEKGPGSGPGPGPGPGPGGMRAGPFDGFIEQPLSDNEDLVQVWDRLWPLKMENETIDLITSTTDLGIQSDLVYSGEESRRKHVRYRPKYYRANDTGGGSNDTETESNTIIPEKIMHFWSELFLINILAVILVLLVLFFSYVFRGPPRADSDALPCAGWCGNMGAKNSRCSVGTY